MNLRDDEGSMSITTAGVIAALSALLLAVLGIGLRVVHHHEAQVAGDLAAVAGAYALYYGDDACAAAVEVASYNRASLGSCREAGRDVILETAQPARATSRAGPL